MKWLRRLRWRFSSEPELICIRVVDTWRWSPGLGAKAEGKCFICREPVNYEEQNAHLKYKICYQCATGGPFPEIPEEMRKRYGAQSTTPPNVEEEQVSDLSSLDQKSKRGT